jgi:hypothetical protein
VIRRGQNLGLLVFSLSATCVSSSSLPTQHSSDAHVQVQSETSAAQDELAPPAKPSPDPPQHSDPDAFLVHTSAGKIELRSAGGKPSHIAGDIGDTGDEDDDVYSDEPDNADR